ncbi:MAG: transcription antitermination factor NusB [Eggerthellaceae bacterium]|nr:transcription antitermination factor NusB [Eggerthellaceae bacterium]
MGAKQKERRDGRIMAVQILYTAEIQAKKPLDLLDEGLCLIEEGPLSDFALEAVRGVQENQERIDECLQSISENWTLARMPMVDLAVLRLAAFEMMYSEDVPLSVAINEAVELAKAFGGEDESPRFVNGVLGRLARKLEEDPDYATRVVDSATPSVISTEASDSATPSVISTEASDSERSGEIPCAPQGADESAEAEVEAPEAAI